MRDSLSGRYALASEILTYIISKFGSRGIERTKLIKLVYLIDRELKCIFGRSLFKWIMWKFGPFSREILDILDDLVYNGTIKVIEKREDDKRYVIYVKENDFIISNDRVRKIIDRIVNEWKDRKLIELLGYVYNLPEVKDRELGQRIPISTDLQYTLPLVGICTFRCRCSIETGVPVKSYVEIRRLRAKIWKKAISAIESILIEHIAEQENVKVEDLEITARERLYDLFTTDLEFRASVEKFAQLIDFKTYLNATVCELEHIISHPDEVDVTVKTRGEKISTSLEDLILRLAKAGKQSRVVLWSTYIEYLAKFYHIYSIILDKIANRNKDKVQQIASKLSIYELLSAVLSKILFGKTKLRQAAGESYKHILKRVNKLLKRDLYDCIDTIHAKLVKKYVLHN